LISFDVAASDPFTLFRLPASSLLPNPIDVSDNSDSCRPSDVVIVNHDQADPPVTHNHSTWTMNGPIRIKLTENFREKSLWLI
jgi:hypothetical protein